MTAGSEKAQRLLAEVEAATDDLELAGRFWRTLLDPELDGETRDAFLAGAFAGGVVQRQHAARERCVETLTEEIRADQERRMAGVDARLRDLLADN
jgi:hypothetical protein